jgi:hypothetical protein
MKLYIAMVKVTNDDEKSYLLTNALSQEAFAIMCDLNLTDQQWSQPDELEKELLARFGDKKTAAGYLIEFRASQQTAKEDVGAFLDRVERLGRKSYPSVFADRYSLVPLELVLKQVQAGLKSDQVAAELSKIVPRSMPELREALVRFETLEAEANLRKKVASSHLGVAESATATASNSQSNSAASSSAPPATAASNSTGGDQKSSRRRGKKGAKGADGQATQSGAPKNGTNAAAAGNGAQSNGTSAQFNGNCWNCGKSGHQSKDCRSAKKNAASGGPQNGHQGGQQQQQGGQRRWSNGPLTCNRCGRNGHLQSRCFSTQHVDGRPLAPATIIYGEVAGQAASGVSTYQAPAQAMCQSGAPLNYYRGAASTRTSRPDPN